MLSPRASAARAPNSTARQFSTGNAPGKPRHTGQVFEFGSSPNRVEQPQKIFDSVLNWAWTSSPMMVSQLFVISPWPWVFGLGSLALISDRPNSNQRPETKEPRPNYGSSQICGI